MLKITNLSVQLSDSKKQILNQVNLAVQPGEVHILNGKNGSGKSTLVNTIMGNPNFEIIKGDIEIIGEKYDRNTLEKIDEDNIRKDLENYTIKIDTSEPNERSLAGIYLANQYPVEIPGVSLTNYLRLIYNNRRTEGEKLPVFKFKKLLEEKANLIKYPLHLLSRNLNEGFSGGEKKKTEILQMILLEPRYVMLDEIDSGLDKESVQEVFEGLVKFKEIYPATSFIIITHYDKAQSYLKPDFIHEMSDGEISSFKNLH